MRIVKSKGHIKIDQVEYLHKVLQRFNLLNAKAPPTPLPECYVTVGTFTRRGLCSTAKTLRSLSGVRRF